MGEQVYRLCDILIKSIGIVAVALGIPIGVSQYRDTKQKEFYSELWNRRLATYEDASNAAALVAISASLESSERHRRDFWRLFYGPMSLIEDDAVKKAMENFGSLLSQAEAGEKRLAELKQPAYKLTLVLRDSLKRTWDRPFQFSSE